ncbi:MAG: MFS transporter [Pseudarcicella sp.]|nr:MFS transporter [Pseudarcicella sp.]MBP6410177.1 MFS transporter [Pseudarcicella sp.]
MFRFFIVVCTFLLALLLYIDRVCISVAKDSIVKDLDLTDTQFGWAMSVFSLGYALFQAPSGSIVDKIGARKVLTLIVSIWSLLTAMTGFAFNFLSLITIRFLFGAGEAGAFPAISSATFSWIPMKERGIVTGINFSGARVGAAFGLPFVAWLIKSLGWQETFFVLGAIGVLWAILWWFIFRDKPENHSLVSESEKQHILTFRQSLSKEENIQKVSFAKLLQSKNMWLTMGQYFCSNFTFFFALTWLFPYIKKTFDLNAVDAGFLTAIPLLMGAVGSWFSGLLIDYLYKTKDIRTSRLLPAVIGFGISAFGLFMSVGQTEVNWAIFYLSLAIFGADMTLPPSWAYCTDIGKKNAGIVSGTMNMAGNLGAFITSLAFPYIQVWTGGVTPFFYVAAALNVIAIFLWSSKKFKI